MNVLHLHPLWRNSLLPAHPARLKGSPLLLESRDGLRKQSGRISSPLFSPVIIKFVALLRVISGGEIQCAGTLIIPLIKTAGRRERRKVKPRPSIRRLRLGKPSLRVLTAASSKKPAADRGRISKPQVRVINGNHSRRRRRKKWKWMGDISALLNRSADQIFDLLLPLIHKRPLSAETRPFRLRGAFENSKC